MTRKSLLAGYVYAAAGAALFSTKAIFIKLAYMEQVNPALMLALRMATSLPFFLAVGLYSMLRMRQRGEPLPDWRLTTKALLTGFMGYYLSALLDFEGLAYISAQLERLVLFTYPMFVMFLGWLFFGARITGTGLLAALITYVGLAVVFLTDLPTGGIETVIGTGLVLACAVTFALYQLLAKKFITRLGAALFTSIALSGSAVACMAHFVVVNGGVGFEASPRFLLLSAGCGVFATVLPSFLVNAGLSRTSPQTTSMIATISPLITISLAVMILGEPFTLADAIGSALVLLGVGFYTLMDQRQAKPAAAGN
jgi:drug/metabolite transporter (DMT)-like permease